MPHCVSNSSIQNASAKNFPVPTSHFSTNTAQQTVRTRQINLVQVRAPGPQLTIFSLTALFGFDNLLRQGRNDDHILILILHMARSPDSTYVAHINAAFTLIVQGLNRAEGVRELSSSRGLSE